MKADMTNIGRRHLIQGAGILMLGLASGAAQAASQPTVTVYKSPT